MTASLKSIIFDHITREGPQTVNQLSQATGQDVRQIRNAVNKLTRDQRLSALLAGKPHAQWYGLPEDPRSVAKREALIARTVVAPSPAEVLETTRRRAEKVLPHVTQAGVTERELTAALPDLSISVLRAALAWLVEDGQVVRSATADQSSRAMFRLNILDLPEPSPKPTLTDVRVERHLTQVTLSGAHDTVINMAAELRVSRLDVERGLAALQRQGKLRSKWVGELALFRLTSDAAAVSA